MSDNIRRQDDKEVWLNPNAGYRYVEQQNFKGEMAAVEIAPGQKFTISTFDRMINQERTIKKEDDMFTNGTFSRVKLIDTAEDYAELAENPNIMSDSDLESMFSLTTAAFKKKLQEIENTRVIERLQRLSEKESLKASVAQQNALKARLDEVDPDRDKLPVFPDYTDRNPIPSKSLS